MADKVVFVKKLEKPNDKNGKPYLKITDQSNKEWVLFRYAIEPQLNKVYLFTFAKNDKGYDEVSEIRQLVNVFEEKAAKKVSDIGDIKKDIGVVLRFSTDLCIAGKIELGQLTQKADELYTYLTQKSTEIFEKSQK